MDRKMIRWRPSPEGVFLFILFFMALRPIENYDFFWHLRAGQDIIQHRSVPKSDPYRAFPTSRRWIDHEWGSQVLFYAAYKIAGWKGILVLKAFLITLVAYMIILWQKKRGVNFFYEYSWFSSG